MLQASRRVRCLVLDVQLDAGQFRQAERQKRRVGFAASILIELGYGRRIRVDGDFDAEALGRVIDVLDRRR